MFDFLDTLISELSQNLRWADAVDILLTTGLLFVLTTWLRRDIPSRVRRGLGGMLASAVALYLLAEFLGLYLIGRVLEVLFLIFLIGIVVIFQADFRRMVDQTTSWNPLRSRSGSESSEKVADVLTEALETMADRNVGALIALKGEEPWDRQTHGGVELEGSLSLPLLYSLFNPTSPAHDGAVLIENNSIKRFAVHLPLSRKLPEHKEYGTRHAAALGLAESTDALVLVVSEERGEISIAEKGRLVTVETGELKRRLENFAARDSPDASDAASSALRWEHLQTAGLSLVLAVCLWLVFAYSPNIWSRPYNVPIAYQNLPEGWQPAAQPPQEARISVSGPRRTFETFNTENLTVVVELENPREGENVKKLSSTNVKLPAGLTLNRIDPEAVTVELEQLHPIRLPVEVQTTGELSEGLEISSITVAPDSVTIVHPSPQTHAGDRVPTAPIDLGTITESTELTRPLELFDEARLSGSEESTVEVRIDIESADDGGSSP